MREYKIETVTRVTKEYSIEADPTFGVPWNDLIKLAALAHHYAEAAEQPFGDDVIRVFPEGDRIVLRVEENETRE